jgi:nucleoside-diphosphate-sugar epimerase
MNETVLILGARGRFGLAAARAFANAGWRVLAQMRPGGQVPVEAADDARLTWLPIDLTDTDALANAASGAQVIVHALNPAYTDAAWKSDVLRMTDASIALARRLHATVMVPGNIYNFGAHMPAVLREDTPQHAATVKGQIRIAMELQLQRSGAQCIVIRAGDFFGSGAGTWFDQAVVKDLPKGIVNYPGQRDVASAWAYLPDLGQTFVAVAEKREQLGRFEIFHFRGHSLSGGDWLQALQSLVGPLRYRGMPWPVIRIGALFNPTWASLLEMRYLWHTPHALANDKLVALLGAEPHTPLAAAAQTSLTSLGLMPATTE